MNMDQVYVVITESLPVSYKEKKCIRYSFDIIHKRNINKQKK